MFEYKSLLFILSFLILDYLFLFVLLCVYKQKKLLKLNKYIRSKKLEKRYTKQSFRNLYKKSI